MSREVILFSGGMDSVALAFRYPEALLLHVRINTVACEREDGVISRIGDALQRWVSFHCVPLSQFELPNQIIPFRNAILALIAFQYAPVVLLGATAGDTTPDKDESWAYGMTQLVRHMSQDSNKNPVKWMGTGGVQPEVLVPLRDMTKTEILAECLRKGISKDVLRLSRSCYGGNARECGRCRSCFRKWVAYVNNDVQHLLDMETNPGQHASQHVLKDRGRESEDTTMALQKAGVNV